MPTKTPREILEDRLKEFVKKRNVSALWQEDFELLTDFMETLLEEARQAERTKLEKEFSEYAIKNAKSEYAQASIIIVRNFLNSILSL